MCYGMVPPIVDRSSYFINAIKIITHMYAHDPLFHTILDSAMLTIGTHHHILFETLFYSGSYRIGWSQLTLVRTDILSSSLISRVSLSLQQLLIHR